MAPEQPVILVIVDDDSGHLELVRRSLRRARINNPILTLGNGSEALDFVFCRGAHAGRPRGDEFLLLLDINMPGIDGVEVLRRIKADPETKKTPVLMLTTTDDPREVERCYELGCNAYFTKPMDPTAFIQAVRRLGLLMSVETTPSAK
jgi:CheY-like chemotaxis protein